MWVYSISPPRFNLIGALTIEVQLIIGQKKCLKNTYKHTHTHTHTHTQRESKTDTLPIHIIIESSKKQSKAKFSFR